MNRHKLGLTLGFFAGLIHLVWVVLVALGVAQSLVNWIYGMHFLEFSYIVAPFSFGKAIILILMASVMGYVMGHVLTAIWNRVNR